MESLAAESGGCVVAGAAGVYPPIFGTVAGLPRGSMPCCPRWMSASKSFCVLKISKRPSAAISFTRASRRFRSSAVNGLKARATATFFFNCPIDVITVS
jgi:hypothetical protein